MANTIRLFPWELDSMPEYSTSLPSGTTVWKQWKRNLNFGTDAPPQWVVGQYIPHPRSQRHVRIRFSRVELVQGPLHPRWSPPDWDRLCYYRIGGFNHPITHVPRDLKGGYQPRYLGAGRLR